MLGEGTFGKVIRVRGDDGALFARKTMKDDRHAQQEIDVLRKSNCERIVKFIVCFKCTNY